MRYNVSNVIHRSTLMSNMPQIQRSSFPSSSWRALRVPLWVPLLLTLEHLGRKTHRLGALRHLTRRQCQITWIPHLRMAHTQRTLLCQVMTKNIRVGSVTPAILTHSAVWSQAAVLSSASIADISLIYSVCHLYPPDLKSTCPSVCPQWLFQKL